MSFNRVEIYRTLEARSVSCITYMNMWMVQSKCQEKISAKNNKAHDWGMLSCCFPSVRFHPQHSTWNSPPKSAVERREEAGTTYRGPEVRNGVRRPEYIARGFAFLLVSDAIWYLLSFWRHLRPTAILHTTLSFSFPYFSPSWQARTRCRQSCSCTTIKPHAKLQEFTPERWTALPSTRSVNYNQATRCHSPEYRNVPTPCLLHRRLT